MDPMVAARYVLNGILNNDLYIVAEPEYRAGVEARCNALVESMVQFKPLPTGVVARKCVSNADLPAGDRASQRRRRCGTSPGREGRMS